MMRIFNFTVRTAFVFCMAYLCAGHSGAKAAAFEEIEGEDYIIRGGTYWSKLLPFKITAPAGWKIHPQKGFNPKVVFTLVENGSQAELYWVRLFESAELDEFIREFLAKSSMKVESQEAVFHPDGRAELVYARHNGIQKRIFFIKVKSRIFIVSCGALSQNQPGEEKDFFFLADSFRLFEGYKIK